VNEIASERPRPELRVLVPGAPDFAEAMPAPVQAPRRPRRPLLVTSWERRFVALAYAWGVGVLAWDILRYRLASFDGLGDWTLAVYGFYTVPFALAILAQFSAIPSLRAGVLAATLLPAAALTLLQEPDFGLTFLLLAAAAFAAGRSAGRQFWNLTTPERALVVAGAISVVWLAGLLLLYEGHRSKGAHCWVVTTAADGAITRDIFDHHPGTPHRLPLDAPPGAVMECLPSTVRALPLAEAMLLLGGTGILAVAALRPPRARNQSARI
jgi:hypothetical protein